jgi:hypothetical protein
MMRTFIARPLLILLALVLLPATSYAQAAITGVVKDASGGVVPGVTVEAASPVLIERVRAVVSDATGQYRIVDLRPGTYSVTFTLPGFSSVKREGIELSGTFVATVNTELKVGDLEETITVTAETPVVDVQSVKVQQTMNKDVIASIPVSRNTGGIQAVIPGMSNTGDSGNIGGNLGGIAGNIHGGRVNDSRTYADGTNVGWAGGAGGGGNMTGSTVSAEEVVLTTSGGLGEAETAGVVLNVIPRDGGNTFSGSFVFSGANDAMQGSNYTQALKDAGLETPSELLWVYDVSSMGGGRIIRDKLWFYLTYRQTSAMDTIPGMWFNKNAGNPNAWVVEFDKDRPAFSDGTDKNGVVRITWQATPRNKINLHWSEQYNVSSSKGGGTATVTPEALGRTLFQPSHIQQATWSSPVTSRILLEAAWGAYQARYRNPMPRIDGTYDPRMIRLVEQGGPIPGLVSRAAAGVGGGFNHHLIGTLASVRASASYVTGAHNMKVGYQGGYSNPSTTFDNFNQVIRIRAKDGLANQLVQTIVTNNNIKYVRILLPNNLYAQDVWTSNHLTLQGGLRLDTLRSRYPDQRVGGPGYPYAPQEIFYPAGSTPGWNWKDITPRMGVAYDLFGYGKTALKFNLGKYKQAIHASDYDMNPMVRTVISTTRTWTDNGDFVVGCSLTNPAKNGECGAMNDQKLGQPVFNRDFDPRLITGWNTRPDNWGLGFSVQQQIVPRVSATVGYFRNWWDKWYVVDNRATSFADYTPFSIVAPIDSRLPNGGGYTVSGLYNLVPSKVGAVDELAVPSTDFGRQVENWQGVDVNVVARLRNGLTVQGGTSTGRRLADACDVRARLPELGGGNPSILLAFSNADTNNASVRNPYCRIAEPYKTDVRGLATYTVPKVNVQVSGTWVSLPGVDLAANYTVTSAIAKPSLGRDLSSGNVAVNLIPPQTVFADRRNNIDFRVAKIFRYNRTRTQVGVDIYNVTNTDVITGFNYGFVPGGSWLRPNSIQPARYARISAQVDF